VNANVTWQEYEASMYTTVRWVEKKCETREYTVNNAVHVTQVLAPTEVLLDNQADISIIHPMLLTDVHKSERRIRVKGVGGLQLIVDETEQQSAEVELEVENPEEIPEESTTQETSEQQLLREEPQTSVEVESVDEETEKQEVRTRSGRAITGPARFANVTKVNQSEWKEKACEDAIKAELKQLFIELKALRAIRRAEITKSAKVLKSQMFLVRKYLANGTFEKVKARLVADGRDQDSDLYPNKSSPTVAIHSVFTVLGLAATKAWRMVIKIDVKGAFVQTPMQG